MTDKDFLLVVWSAINADFDPLDVMRAIEKRVGIKPINAKWKSYFDDKRGTINAIKDDLKKA